MFCRGGTWSPGGSIQFLEGKALSLVFNMLGSQDPRPWICLRGKRVSGWPKRIPGVYKCLEESGGHLRKRAERLLWSLRPNRGIS